MFLIHGGTIVGSWFGSHAWQDVCFTGVLPLSNDSVFVEGFNRRLGERSTAVLVARHPFGRLSSVFPLSSSITYHIEGYQLGWPSDGYLSISPMERSILRVTP